MSKAAKRPAKGKGAAQPPSPAITALDAAIDSALAEKRLVGTVVIMAEDGVITYHRAAGFADREAGIAMEEGTWFRYASISKAFTTVAALRLVQAGRLSPDDPVSRWLPDFRPALADGSPAEITVGDLMAHMAGLDYGFNQTAEGSYARAGVSDGISERGISLAENLHRIASVPIDIAPAKDWRYSMATDVLGAVIEAASDAALPFAMAELVTGPLAIDAAFSLPSTHNLAAAYADAETGTEPRRMEGVTRVQGLLPEGQAFAFDPERITDLAAYPSGGGGMAGTAEGALTLIETLRAGDFLAPEWREAAAADRARFTDGHPLRGPGYGHAWAGAVHLDPAQSGVGLSKGSLAWGGIYGHSWFVDPERKRSVVALTNTAVEGMSGQFSSDIRDATAL